MKQGHKFLKKGILGMFMFLVFISVGADSARSTDFSEVEKILGIS
jgi:hypothetical protein